MKDGMTSEETLVYLIKLLSFYLEELQQYDVFHGQDAFICGEKTAYVECLEVIQKWRNAKEHGLNYDVESRFPLV